MATRSFLSSTATTPVTPAYDAGWTRTTDADRREMSPTNDGSSSNSKTFWGSTAPAADDTCLNRQYVGAPMAAGNAFVTSDTVKCQIRCLESAADDNIDRALMCYKIVSEDGTTLRATLLPLGHYGPNTTEWPTVLTNKTFADGDALTAGYTTVDGDREVLELGGKITAAAGGTSTLGTMSFKSISGAALGENETDTTALNPWFENSRTITYQGAGGGTDVLIQGMQDLAQQVGPQTAVRFGGLVQE